jgi:hypothetical protein
VVGLCLRVYSCAFAVAIRGYSGFHQSPLTNHQSRLTSDLSYGKELPEKISEFIDRPDHGKTGVEDRVLSLHRNKATPDIDHGAHFIFDTECLQPIGAREVNGSTQILPGSRQPL